ncbi:MAG: hypothetical protein AVDCRST_MAG19-2455, partial [uncultured Thermomicrobiales bacterium]
GRSNPSVSGTSGATWRRRPSSSSGRTGGRHTATPGSTSWTDRGTRRCSRRWTDSGSRLSTCQSAPWRACRRCPAPVPRSWPNWASTCGACASRPRRWAGVPATRSTGPRRSVRRGWPSATWRPRATPFGRPADG